ncbi:two-component response regulator ORR22-like [Lotus japonicus]|uniref:two-component response regulator ORR22-like n=1 Tax=Lotus japonicus TaxID=34305 RepID=UPI002589ED3E|nr:two-component response regulator ORR22-like [Lotus japonicus]
MVGDDHRDQFPIGMHVLAVDDDPTCLMILEAMLRKCQYKVTATDNAITALQQLRENKDKFDLVITDVHMPEIDGFKFLELVGLIIDIPVILLSVNGDSNMVMKGITHGACHYMLKPVRVEELKTIWQHVIRNRKIGSKEKEGTKTSSNHETLNYSDNGQGSAATPNSDQNGKSSKKRKYQDFDDVEHENGTDSGDSSAPKKPRVVWSGELHQKFLAAVNQLGIDKAVPKKVLKMMDVENLTRENVASHLQKYRLYLKRISSMANQQANPILGSVSRKNAFGSRLNTPATHSSRTLQVDQFQHSKGVSHIPNQNNTFMLEENQRPSELSISNNDLEDNSQDKQTGRVSTSLAPQDSQFSLPLLDNDRSNDVCSTEYLANECFGPASVSCTDNMTPVPWNISCNAPFEGWDNHNQNSTYHSHVSGDSIGSMIPANGDPVNSAFNFCDPLQMNHDEIIELTEECSIKPHQLHVMDQQRYQNSSICNCLGSPEDLDSAMMMKLVEEETDIMLNLEDMIDFTGIIDLTPFLDSSTGN